MSTAQQLQEDVLMDNSSVMDIETNVYFNIIGDDNSVTFTGVSRTLSTTEVSFDTNHSLEKGILLQMTMISKQPNTPQLKTVVEVASIQPIIDGTNSYNYRIDGKIKDIAIGM